MADNTIIDLLYNAKQRQIEIVLNEEGQLQLKTPKNTTVDKNFLRELKDNKELLIEFLSKNSRKTSAQNKITKADRNGFPSIPLSFSQERLWFIDRLEGSVNYHLPSVLRLKGILNREALVYALRQLVNRHEVLRTVFPESEGKAFQLVKEKDNWELALKDGAIYKDDPLGLKAYIRETIRKPFDLSKDDMLRAELLRIDEDNHILIVTVHHIAADGWSISILVKEVAALYQAQSQGRSVSLPPLDIQYADFAIWQRNYLSGDLLEAKTAYWKSKLEGVSRLQLPSDYTRPPIQTSNGATISFKIEQHLTGQLHELGKQENATLFMTLLAAFKVLLFRYSGQKDICVGIPVAGRQFKELEGLIGYFINTLALRSNINTDFPFSVLLQQVRKTTLEAYEHQDLPFEKVVEAVVKERDLSRSPLFQVMLVLQNTPEIEALDLGAVELSGENFAHESAKFEMTLFITERSGELHGSLEYNTDLFNAGTVQRMVGHFKELLSSVVKTPEQRVGELSMLSQSEEQQLLVTFNHTGVVYPKGKTIIDLFEEQVAKNTAKLAVVFKEEQLNFHELNERANQLAAYLKTMGVREEMLVPVFIERSVNMLVGIWAILKAGGAYVPIDPDYPRERIGYILEDTNASIILSTTASLSGMPKREGAEIVLIDEHWPLISTCPAQNIQTTIRPEQLAYLIYTSGSTGKPKGVMIEHANLLSYLLNNKTKYITADERTAGSYIHLSYTFDASLTAMFMPLLAGKPVVIGSKGFLDIFEDINLQKYAPYDFIKITPSHLALLQPVMKGGKDGLLTKKLVIGGEALLPGQLRFLADEGLNVEIINEYGPTEATVGCSVFSFHSLGVEGMPNIGIPIGKPIDNVRLYILGSCKELLPLGAAGELCIAGDGLARGYLNDPGLTAEKFVKDPFSKEASSRMYKTGDLVRWLPDGNIEYLGRIDDQVKIRGYRIELGEIESILHQSELVRQAVVLAKANSEGTKRLIGYIVPGEGFTKEGVTAYLGDRLPEYMIPQLWVQLEHLPLTTNGKVDKKALPDVNANNLTTGGYAAPRNEFEKHLAATWQKLLGIQRTGIHDNFFELGGDSILTIQVVSRMRRLGYELKPKDIFIHQTISKLSAAIAERSDAAVTGEQGTLTGLSGLLPIQQWWLEKESPEINHFNQAVLLSIDKSLSSANITQALDQLTQQHDALRFCYRQVDGTWQQSYGSSNGVVLAEDFQSATNGTLASLIKEKANQHQRRLDIEEGAIIRMVLMQTPGTESHNRLLIVIHHLAIDGVSWRILLEDLEQLLTAISQGQEVVLGSKTSSYRQWYQALEAYGQSRTVLSQKGYWQQAVESYKPLPVDKDHSGNPTSGDMANHSIRLTSDQTSRLLKEIPRVYHTEINDILLCALAGTLCEWSGERKVVIGLEGHGRESITENIDTSRTVGWFTTLYPVLLETEKDTGDLVKSVKEQLRRVPGRGLGYGVLKYINREAALYQPQGWDIVFNYLGQFDNVVNESKWLKAASESTGASISPFYEYSEKLSITASIQVGELVLNWSYSGLHYEAATIQNLSRSYITNLEEIIGHCLVQQQQGLVHTPSDYGLAKEINYRELDAFLAEQFRGKTRSSQVDGIYRLSGLQQGMIFHSLYDDRAGAYTEQFTCDLVNPNLELLTKSWQAVLDNHSILRSGFYYNAFSVPVQCVYKDVSLPVAVEDYSTMSIAEQESAINDYKTADQQKGFDFTAPPLMRISLLKMDATRYRMIWTSHHILFDGWSLPVLMEEFLATYESLVSGTGVAERTEDKFEDYIRYIERENKEAEEAYWRGYLQALEQPALLPFISKTTERTKGSGKYKSLPLRFDTSRSAKIQAFAQQHRLTVNTIMQGVWALLLHHYTGNKNIAYGVIVSGRPDDLANVEKRVGLYINTLPLHASFDGAQKISSWLEAMQAQQVASRQYQYTALQDVQAWAGIPGDLFDSILIFENYPLSEIVGARQWSLRIENVVMHEQTNYPLTIAITSADTIAISFGYNSDLLEDVYIHQLRGHFDLVLEQFVAGNGDTSLHQIDLLTSAERQQILVDFNQSAVPYPTGSSLVDLFEAQVIKTPAALALVYENEQFSYTRLNNLANQLANYLQARGVTTETLVPICMERSPYMIIGILAILKAGGAYVPIDSTYPADRIRYMLEDTGATILLTTEITREKIPATEAEIIALDSGWIEISNEPTTNLPTRVLPKNLAYVIYTSGSTGKPKGVMIEHSGVVSLTVGQARELGIQEGTNYLQFASLGFDASCLEIFSTLLAGGCLVMCNNEDLLSPVKFEFLVNRNRVEIAVLPPSFQHEMRDYLGGIKTIISGGEPLNLATGKYLQAKGIRLINAYGPTETTVCVTMTPQPILEDDTIVIGKPLDNVQVYVLNDRHQPVPIGVTGELCLAGVGVARGYLNRGDLTAEKFISNPFSTDPSATLYKTGDLVRFLPGGDIEYFGRKDEQVKIRGFRIELGEIENVLLQSGLVHQVLVVAAPDQAGNKRLVAYVIADELFNANAAIGYLQKVLPAYMVPALWVALDRFPVTPSGKIDKKALPLPPGNQGTGSEFIAPVTELEIKLAAIWQEMLHLDQVGITDNFFELGGHSLLVMRLVSVMRKELGIEVSIKTLFNNPTISTLAAQIEGAGKQVLLSRIEAHSRPLRIPLSFSQERLWFIDRLEGSSQYHIPVVLRLTGDLNRDALEKALSAIINRHEVLRTVYLEHEGEAFQLIKEPAAWSLPIVDGALFEKDSAGLETYIRQLISAPFDLSTDNMLRASLVMLPNGEHLLLITLHHIASDGWSMPILVQEVTELYTSFDAKRASSLAPLPLQYADFAIWQRNYLQGQVLENKLAYWKEKLKEVEPLQMPLDFSRPPVQTTRGGTRLFAFDASMATSLKALSQQYGATMFMTLTAALKVLLYRYSNQKDICIGTGIAGRQHQEVENLIGFFVNTLALRTSLDTEGSFTDLLQDVRKTTLEAYEHQEVPFEKVVDSVVQKRDRSRNPIFQVMLVFQNTPEVPMLEFGSLKLERERQEHTTALFDLSFSIAESEQGIKGAVEYNADLYLPETIDRLLTHFHQLVRSVIEAPGKKISELSIITKAETEQVLITNNAFDTVYPAHKTITQLFEDEVAANPQATALVFENEEITYKQLNEKANQLAHYLQSNGVQEGSLVAISMERSVNMMVGILAILKAGAAYVPIDAAYPAERIQFMLEDTAAPVLLTSNNVYPALKALANVAILNLDKAFTEIAAHSTNDLALPMSPSGLAYIIYTSGSTGTPKGVMVTHQNVVSLVKGVDYVSLSQADVLLSTGSSSFDATTLEYWGMLLNGGRLVLCREETLMDSELLKNEIDQRGVNKMWFTSSWFNQLVETHIGVFENLQTILVGGEKLSEKHIDKLRQTYPNIEMINGYGPTENTTFSLTYNITGGRTRPVIPIGRPLTNRKAYVLDEKLQPVPVGVPGEIYLGGAGLSAGYLNRPGLTAEKFISNPFGQPGEKMYKTGDIGRWLPGGNVEYLGRVDEQVKIRGYRIELGEIEAVLQQSGFVSQAVVVVLETEGNKNLAAYIVPTQQYEKNLLLSLLQTKLPDYMVPSLWVEMEQLPLTTNGKINKRALPMPHAAGIDTHQYEAPVTEMQKQLAVLWENILRKERIGLNDNFFELGGHSLLAMRLISAVRKELAVEISVKDLFMYPTIAAMGDYLQQQVRGPLLPRIEVAPRTGRIPLSFSQERLWFIDQLTGSFQYNSPAVLQLKGKLDLEALRFALQNIVSRHEVLRTVFNEADGKPFQTVLNEDDWKLSVVDGSAIQHNGADLQSVIARMVAQPFDLSKDYMLRATLLSVAPDEYILVVVMHHIASDGWSMPIIVKEVIESYTAYSETRATQLPALPLQYADYAIWQRNHLEGEILMQKTRYWKKKLEGVTKLDLPTDFARPATKSVRGASLNFRIGKELADQLDLLSQQQGTTLYMTLLATFKILLHRYTGQQDICVGTSIANRPQQELEDLVGFFVNTLGLRTQVIETSSFEEILQQVKITTLEAYEHQDVPFEKVVEEVVKERDASRTPLFQVMLVLLNMPGAAKVSTGGIELSPFPVQNTISKFDLTFHVTPTANGLSVSVEYSTDLFREDTITRMSSHFTQLLQSVVKNPQETVESLQMLTDAEEQQLLLEFN